MWWLRLLRSPDEDEFGGNTLVLSGHPRTDRPESRTRGLLTVLSGLDQGRVVSIEPGVALTLGRSPECGLFLPDQGLSRVHAQVTQHGQLFLVLDQGSRNGTFVNHTRIDGQRPLRDGDRISLGAETRLRFSLATSSEEAALKKTYEGATFDGLTGVFNRAQLERRLGVMVEASRRDRQPLALAMIDVDHFKRVNDTWGHLAGDEVLRVVAQRIRQGVRLNDLVGRYGGEEFVVALRGADTPTLAIRIDAIRKALSEQPIAAQGQSLRVTCSAGVASLDESAEPTVTALLAHADERLYLAKRGGRDRVVAG